MSRAERLLALPELLRRHRRPVSGPDLARELGILSTVGVASLVVGGEIGRA